MGPLSGENVLSLGFMVGCQKEAFSGQKTQNCQAVLCVNLG